MLSVACEQGALFWGVGGVDRCSLEVLHGGAQGLQGGYKMLHLTHAHTLRHTRHKHPH